MTTKFAKDLFERVAATYVQVFLGLVLAGWTDVLNISTFKVAAVSAIPAALAVLKGAIAKSFGDPDSASLTNDEADYGVDNVE